MAGNVYCLDTSALVHAWVRAYPPPNFPSFWTRLDDAITVGRVRSPVDVYVELEKKDDRLFEWAKERKHFFVDLDIPMQEEVRAILRAYPRLLDTRKMRSGADPMVIALARLNSGIVVTQEGETGKLEAPHIPDVCRALGVSFVDLLGMIRAEAWSM